MSDVHFKIVPFNRTFNRTTFSSESDQLDRYLKEQVTQDIKRRVATCFCAIDSDNNLAGYYTLASSSFLLTDLPLETQKKLPKYPAVPVVLMGRLAVDHRYQGQGLGSALLSDALIRSHRAEIAAFALFVDAKDNEAVAFYKHQGFRQVLSEEKRLYMPLSLVNGVLF